MFARLLFLFVVVPLAELYLLFLLANRISFGATVGLVMLTGVLGAWLAKQQGLSTLLKIQRELAEGRMPGRELADGAMILVAGALLLTPGMMTDCFGFSLLVPPCRAVYRKLLGRMDWNVTWHVSSNVPGYETPNRDPNVVDGSARRTDGRAPTSQQRTIDS